MPFVQECRNIGGARFSVFDPCLNLAFRPFHEIFFVNEFANQSHLQ